MKKTTLLKTMLLLCALVVGSASSWADTYTLGWGSASGTNYTNFTSTSGTVTDIVSFSTANNSATSSPAYNSSNKELRLYNASNGNGCSITLSPDAGITISAVSVIASSTDYTPSVKYKVDGGSATAASLSSTTYTISGIEASSSIVIQNVNTATKQLRIKTIQITYTSSGVTKHTATFSVNGETSNADFAEGADIDFPAVSGVSGLKFMGWTTSAIVGTQASAPDPLLTEATMSTSNITYYAVFAYRDAGKFVLDYNAESALATAMKAQYGYSVDYTASDGSDWVVKAYKSAGMQINTGKDCSIKIPTCPSDIKSIKITCSAAKAVGLSASDYSGSGTITYIVYGTDATSQTLDFTGKSAKSGYIVPKTGSTSITKIEVIYSEDDITLDYCTTIPTTKSVTVGANGYTTFVAPYNLDLTDANRPAGLKAYKATLSGKNLTFTALNQTVPAGTGLLLLGETKGGSYNINVATSGTAVSNNAMIGALVATSKKSSDPGTYYFVMKKAASDSDPLAFAPLSTASSVTIPAGKAYIEVPSTAFAGGGAHDLTFGFEDTGATGICSVENDELQIENAKIYNLAGQRVAQPTKGLYIVNGKKVIVK